ncbi:chaperonin 10-like protein [Cristinia sonorae]|uniref:Chaperonin 10-like protein n=1 Tax=Cristinia sonorae TaxID=1940300 RepID=A0A8K0UCT1_9AGAR|nr:chaperonin 10-like protein [Cristinia sonorae]
MAEIYSKTQRAVRWYPPAYDIRVETVPVPKSAALSPAIPIKTLTSCLRSILHPDDAIVKITLAGLCGSDLHVYRGHEDVNDPLICGHEFIGEVVALGASFSSDATNRPALYSDLKLGDKVVSPFTVSCGECHFCRAGISCRCIHSKLFGIPDLPGGQAQYVRVPKAGGTLFKVDSITSLMPPGEEHTLADSSLLLLADILPTGAFAALQALQHPKISPWVNGSAYPYNSFVPEVMASSRPPALPLEDRALTFAVIGLGPVGVCATVSLLHLLAEIHEKSGVTFRVVAVDPNASRREKMQSVLALPSFPPNIDTVVVADIEDAKGVVARWTGGVGCNAILEVVGNNSALTLAYELVRPFGLISSVGVHQAPQLPLTGREAYDKNVSFDFGRCPVRSMLPIASSILIKRQDVFGGIGDQASLIEKVVGFEEAAEVYDLFDKGRCGKVLFDPWQ